MWGANLLLMPRALLVLALQSSERVPGNWDRLNPDYAHASRPSATDARVRGGVRCGFCRHRRTCVFTVRLIREIPGTIPPPRLPSLPISHRFQTNISHAPSCTGFLFFVLVFFFIGDKTERRGRRWRRNKQQKTKKKKPKTTQSTQIIVLLLLLFEYKYRASSVTFACTPPTTGHGTNV